MIKVWTLKEIIKCNFHFNHLVFFLHWETVRMYFAHIDSVLHLKKIVYLARPGHKEQAAIIEWAPAEGALHA